MNTHPEPEARPINYEDLQSLLPKRDRIAHKGDHGHALIIGGDQGYGGAAMMAGEGAARSGAGLISVATHPSHVGAFLSHRPELMCKGIDHAEQIDPLLSKASVIILGPGLGQTDWSTSIFNHVMQSQNNSKTPMILDADALNLLSLGMCSDMQLSQDKYVLTPHPGEASRLLSTNIDSIQHNREAAAKGLQAKYSSVIVLKGAGSLIAYQQANTCTLDRCTHGNPGMASGGMGDVLSGVIGGLIAQHLSLQDAARLGVCIHALSADKSSVLDGERGMLASDLLPWIRRLVNPR